MLVLSALFCISASAQKITTTIDRDKILIGEQLNVKINVHDVDLVSTPVTQDIQIPDTVNHLEILSHTVDTFTTSGTATYVHHLVITSFDSGYWQLPAFEIVLGDNKKLASEPLGINVLPVDVSNLQDYHDIKDILEVPLENNWYIIAAIVALALISLFAVFWFIQKKQAVKVQQVKPGTLADMYDELMQMLNEQQRVDLYNASTVKKAFAQSTEAVRSFLDIVWMKKTMHLTTGEYMTDVKGRISSAEEQTKYFQFLRLADAVKFAKYLPPVEESKGAINNLKNFVTLQYEHNKPTS
jgi:hypothetical protein